MRVRSALLAAALALGCGTSVGPVPPPPEGAVDLGAGAALEFHARSEAFYKRLIRRRFDALETFNDRFLRSHFRTEEAFFDYYAGLANDLDQAHFERSRPSDAVVIDFLFGTPDTALVQVQFTGADARPLRPGHVPLTRVDRWDRNEDEWWVTPRGGWD